MFKSIRLTFTGILCAIYLIITILIVNLIQCISLIFIPFSRKLSRKVNWWVADQWWSYCVICIEKIQGVQVIFSGDDVPSHENALLVANHQNLTDVLFILSLAYRKNRVGDLKWFVKDILKYIPGMGWGLWFLDCVFLKRNWTQDHASIEAAFRNIKENKIPIWLVSFLEGTRLTPKKLTSSQNYAKKAGLPHFNHVLVPKTKGFVATVQGLGGHVTAVYDLTIGYPLRTPSLWTLISGKMKYPVHIDVRRYALTDLPKDPQKLAYWALDRFKEKDRWLADLHQHYLDRQKT